MSWSIDVGPHALQLDHLARRAHAGHHVLALGVDEELAVELVDAAGGVTCEGHTGAAVVAGVAVDHRLHVDRRAPVVGDAVQTPVGDGAVVVPAAEHGADGAPELPTRVVGELVAGAVLDGGLELRHKSLEVVGVQLGVELDALGLLGRVEDLFERVPLVLVLGFETADHVAVHADEPAVAVVGEARIAGGCDDALDGRVVEAQIQDGVHHPRHGGAGARAHAEEQRVRGVAELLAGVLLQRGEGGLHLGVQAGGVVLVRGVVIADLGRDREPRGHRQADGGHLGEVGPLAAEQLLHVLVAFAEPVHVLVRHLSSSRGLSSSRRDGGDGVGGCGVHVCVSGRRLNSPIAPMSAVTAASWARRLARTASSWSITSTSSK